MKRYGSAWSQCSLITSTITKRVFLVKHTLGLHNRLTNIALYSSGDVTILSDVTFILNSDLNGKSPQFTLKCTSTGGPATTVTWTRDSETVSGGMTVLDDPE